MRKIYPLLILAIGMVAIGCRSTYQLSTIDRVTVYKKFIKNGSTGSISGAFNQPGGRQVNATEFVDTSPSDSFMITSAHLTDALSKAKKIKKHPQQKVPGIHFAGEFYEGNEKHYFAYFLHNNKIIDFTDRKEYHLSAPLHYVKQP